jgi:hypothetical protein
MTESSSGVPAEIADGEVAAPQEESPSTDLHLDHDKVEAWDEVKADYEVEPAGEPVPNSMDATAFEPVGDDRDDRDPPSVEEAARDGGDR